MKFDTADLQRSAAEYGFQPDSLEKEAPGIEPFASL